MKKEQKNPKAVLPKGFKDNDEITISVRKKVSKTIEEVCQNFGFRELETPAFEFTDALGKFLPDIDRPSGGVFSIQDEDNQWISLRYDLTAPLARFVAANYQNIVKPFKRYQSGNVWRNEKPGPGRYREFRQFDADVIGVQSANIDAELCVMVAKIFEKLGLSSKDYRIKYSNRMIWNDLFNETDIPLNQISDVLRAIDKLDRFGEDGVRELLTTGRKDQSGDVMSGVGLSDEQAESIVQFIKNGDKSNEQILDFENYLSNFPNLSIDFDPSVVRGLDYYTGMVFEAELLFKVKNNKGVDVVFGSVAGGGRYDKLISRFGKEDVPATGISIGVDRLVYALQQRNDFDVSENPLVVIVNMNNENLNEYVKIAEELRNNNIPCEISFGSQNLGKQLKYCDKRNASIAIIAGDEELEKGVLSIKDLSAGKEISKQISERDEWKESKAGQINIERQNLISSVLKIIKK
jgi:histidyl-tRNA synthetase